MRDVDGLQPQEAFDELLKYLFMKESADETHHQFTPYTPCIFHNDDTSRNKELANELRKNLKVFLDQTNSWSNEIWQERTFNLSDHALLGVHALFENTDFCTVEIDSRSAALNEFIPGELRKGLGIFPTPDAVARMMVEVVSPPVSSRVLDPACGTGTFLVELIRRWRINNSRHKPYDVWGVDKSARMLLLSELNLGHSVEINYRGALADSLYKPPSTVFHDIAEDFDCILTNPPFGVILDRNKHDMTQFKTCRIRGDRIVKRQQSEVVFVEQCMKYLKPGGMLGIVLPRSVVTNASLHFARQAFNKLGYLETIVTLPPETFAYSGTQTNTVVLFLRRFKTRFEKIEPVNTVSVNVNNVGFDSTGRPRKGNQLENVLETIRAARNGKDTSIDTSIFPSMAKESSVEKLPSLLTGRIQVTTSIDVLDLKDLVEFAGNGKTPSRATYSSEGLFLVKVGNLTGRGINWEARERNFVDGLEEDKRRKSPRLMLRKRDILLTSCAHSPVYIAKKVDIVGEVPKWVGSDASFVGETMMLRVKDGVDPYVLVAYLRLPSIQHRIQTMVRGQTAHLHTEDLLQLHVLKSIFEPTSIMSELANRIKKETKLAEELNDIVFGQKEIVATIEKNLIK